ncbi:Crp/Fnr family transcriptional regulator [Bradyrhizobium commune]|uniref:Cyclic nucleotide-binding domain-containing protein n=1 Tax=Bradyrhizobium commune TaxID=83627 RepID=A0A7S9GW67_9BRAD|nr:cyclic nucleotide-binding domain-containing protein [Bradyrhizobium commune]QPF88485.1 cyclic nucleotide-binding domain-containing protein [Bradyrhizobium commune]
MAETSSVQAVWQGFDRLTFAAGETIFAEGDLGAAAFILLQGDVTLRAASGGGTPRAVIALKPGQMFGMHTLMADARRGATAATIRGCEVIRVSEETLRRKLEESDPFIRYWVDYLSKRIVDLSQP